MERIVRKPSIDNCCNSRLSEDQAQLDHNLIENEAGERRPATRDEITNPKGVRFFQS